MTKTTLPDGRVVYQYTPQEIDEARLKLEVSRQLSTGHISKARTNLSYAGEMAGEVKVGLSSAKLGAGGKYHD